MLCNQGVNSLVQLNNKHQNHVGIHVVPTKAQRDIKQQCQLG